MSLRTQAKILRILQEQTFERVGGLKRFELMLGSLLRTNKNLQEEIKAGRYPRRSLLPAQCYSISFRGAARTGSDVILLLSIFCKNLPRI